MLLQNSACALCQPYSLLICTQLNNHFTPYFFGIFSISSQGEERQGSQRKLRDLFLIRTNVISIRRDRLCGGGGYRVQRALNPLKKNKFHFLHSKQTPPMRLWLYIHFSAARKSEADRGGRKLKQYCQAGSNTRVPKSTGEPPRWGSSQKCRGHLDPYLSFMPRPRPSPTHGRVQQNLPRKCVQNSPRF